ncbi:MAG TPA: ParB N-terminal domain-containing protein, partial [bacterium]|nr:ParB N-terminal domain-containing protein [bacterium]
MSPVANAVAQIVDIPLGQILANPENPRGPVDPQAAQAMAESLQAKGQQVEIRVRALTEAEKTKYPGYEYLLIGGHVRLAGAKLAGLAILRAVVLEGLSEDEEELAAILDNRWEPMSWWRWDLAIERRMKRYTGQTQRKVAAELGLSAAKVNNAWKITRVLTPEARKTLEKSVQALNTENKGFSITEVHLLVLAELGDAEQVERALGAVLDDYLTPDQCKKLVAWVKAGNPVDSFKVGQVQKAPAVVSPEPKTESQVKEDRKAVVDPGDADSGDRASGSMSKPSPLGGEGGVRGASAGHTPLQELYLYLTSDPLRKFLAANLKRALGTLTRRWMVHGILALGLLLLLGRSWIGKLLAAKPLAPAVSQTQPAPTQSQTASDTETSQNQPASPYPAIGHKPMATN